MTKSRKKESKLLPMIEAGQVIPFEILPTGGPAGMFYWSDFAMSCQEMPRDSIGAYMLLLCHHGNRGSLPADAMALQRIACGIVPGDVLKKFVRIKTTEGDRFVNLRLLVELERYQNYIKRQSHNGKRKWEKENLEHGNDATASANEHATASAATDAKSMPPIPIPIPSNSFFNVGTTTHTEAPTNGTRPKKEKPQALSANQTIDPNTLYPRGWPITEEEKRGIAAISGVDPTWAIATLLDWEGNGFKDSFGGSAVNVQPKLKAAWMRKQERDAKANQPQNGYPPKNGERRDMSKQQPGETREQYLDRILKESL